MRALKQSLVAEKRCKRPKFKKRFSMDYREQASHARGVYLTEDTSCMGYKKSEIIRRIRHKNPSKRVV